VILKPGPWFDTGIRLEPGQSAKVTEFPRLFKLKGKNAIDRGYYKHSEKVEFKINNWKGRFSEYGHRVVRVSEGKAPDTIKLRLLEGDQEVLGVWVRAKR
jgi:hypothetical protein